MDGSNEKNKQTAAVNNRNMKFAVVCFQTVLWFEVRKICICYSLRFINICWTGKKNARKMIFVAFFNSNELVFSWIRRTAVTATTEFATHSRFISPEEQTSQVRADVSLLKKVALRTEWKRTFRSERCSLCNAESADDSLGN